MSYEHGIAEGQKLISLIKRIYESWDDIETFESIKFGVAQKRMDQYWSLFTNHKPTAEISGFLSTIMPEEYFDAGVIKMFGLEETVEYNNEYAPLCNFEHTVGFAGFAHWTGESDGDAWVVDLNSNQICSIDVGEYHKTYEEILSGSYAKCSTLSQFRAYLLSECVEREWLTGKDRQELA